MRIWLSWDSPIAVLQFTLLDCGSKSIGRHVVSPGGGGEMLSSAVDQVKGTRHEYLECGHTGAGEVFSEVEARKGSIIQVWFGCHHVTLCHLVARRDFSHECMNLNCSSGIHKF